MWAAQRTGCDSLASRLRAALQIAVLRIGRPCTRRVCRGAVSAVVGENPAPVHSLQIHKKKLFCVGPTYSVLFTWHPIMHNHRSPAPPDGDVPIARQVQKLYCSLLRALGSLHSLQWSKVKFTCIAFIGWLRH